MACSTVFSLDEVVYEDAAYVVYAFAELGIDTNLLVVRGTGTATQHMLIYYEPYEFKERYRVAGPSWAEEPLIGIRDECGAEP